MTRLLAASAVLALTLLPLLAAAAASVVIRYRRTTGRQRDQVAWFALAGLGIPLTLLLCWLSYLTLGGADRLLLLDEPSLGLAPSVVDDVFEVVGALHREGVAVLLVEQNVARALAVATRAYVLAEGRIVAEGPVADLLAQPHVRSAYLGDGGP